MLIHNEAYSVYIIKLAIVQYQILWCASESLQVLITVKLLKKFILLHYKQVMHAPRLAGYEFYSILYNDWQSLKISPCYGTKLTINKLLFQDILTTYVQLHDHKLCICYILITYIIKALFKAIEK